MAFCEICGRESLLSRTKIENTELLVCGSCSTFGKVIKTNIEEPEVPKARKPQIYNETVEIIPEGYGKKVKDARTWAGLNQKEFAFKLSEKESVINKIESEHLMPTLELAKKIERLCEIKIIESYKEEKKPEDNINFRDGGLTIGDIIKLKDEE